MSSDLFKPKFFQQKILKVVLIILFLFFGVFLRLNYLNEKGGDFKTHEKAILDFMAGNNIYEDTIKSYSQKNTGDHGYAYFPTLMYIYIPLYRLSNLLNIEPYVLFKIPVFLADVLVGIIIFKFLYGDKKDFWSAFFGTAFWWINPHLVTRGSYAHTEPLGIIFLILALKNLEKSDVKAGFFYAISFSLKSFSLVLFPLFLFKSKNKLKFLISGAVFAFIISIPFMASFQNFITYIQGSILVHGSREPQGRPLLGYLSFLINKSRYYVIFTQPLKYLSLIFGSIVSAFLYFKKKITDKYVLAFVCMLFFYLLTPVFMRTYLIWFLPLYAVGVYNFIYSFKNKIKKNFEVFYFLSLSLFWGFYAFYLSIWEESFWFSENGIGL